MRGVKGFKKSRVWTRVPVPLRARWPCPPPAEFRVHASKLASSNFCVNGHRFQEEGGWGSKNKSLPYNAVLKKQQQQHNISVVFSSLKNKRMYSQTRRLTFPMTLSELKPKKCEQGFSCELRTFSCGSEAVGCSGYQGSSRSPPLCDREKTRKGKIWANTDKLNRVKHSLEKTGDVKETLKLVRVVKDKKRRQRKIS